MKDILVDNRFRIDYKIGQGGYGLVYAGTDLKTNEEVALKLMHARDGNYVLSCEADTYKELSGGTGIPQVRWFGQECDYYVLVHDILGPSLEDLLNYCGRSLSLKTVLLIADQAISRVAYIHSKGFMHGDIKPDNFLMGVGRQGNVLYAIDFGLARESSNNSRGEWTGTGRFCGGTVRYASINNHLGRSHSWGDDLESLGYVLLYLSRGSLPWMGLKQVDDKSKTDLVKEKKMSLSVEELCEGLPDEFATYISYARSLGYQDEPNYAYLRQLFRRLFVARGFEYDNVFDWTIKRFIEIHGRISEPTSPVSKPRVQPAQRSGASEPARQPPSDMAAQDSAGTDRGEAAEPHEAPAGENP